MKNITIWWVNILSGEQILHPHENNNHNLEAPELEENTLIYEIREWVNLSWDKREEYWYYLIKHSEWDLKVPIKIQKNTNSTYNIELWNHSRYVDEQGLIDALKNVYSKEISSKPPFMLRKTVAQICSEVKKAL